MAQRSRQATRQISMLAYPDCQILDVTGPLEVFARTSRWLGERRRQAGPAYAVEIVARRPGMVTASSGLGLRVDRTFGAVRGPIDTLLVAGGIGCVAAMGDRPLLSWVRRMAPRVRRLGSVCTGAGILAEAGLLDGRRVTTHWSYAERLAALYPKVEVDPEPIFVRDGKIWTSAGVTAGMDLALALVEEDHGHEVALAVARELVMFLKRPGGQSQFSAQLAAQAADREPLRELQAWVAENPAEDLRVPLLARRAGMSPRHFARVFASSVGTTPARFIERVRVETARRRLEETAAGVDAVAAECGFGSAEVMRRAFLRALRVSPADYRRRFRLH
ncbi:MAG TPA: GlxA family transcriptional regulator [Myxococcota bacterium]|jgi:transcriptional regulator GlxA family with amidase domain|nr:GlxA family transcriptional regulator [Myxococcota bacterium]